MPIQFRCPSCDRMLGIAKRKAGSSVKCPRCGADVSVPALAGMAVETNGPVGAAPAIPKGSSNTATVAGPSVARRAERKVDSMPLFERPDFESLLNPALEKVKPEAVVAVAVPVRVTPLPSQAYQPYVDESAEVAIDVEDLSNTIILTRNKLTIAVAAVAVLMGIAFAVGYFLAAAATPPMGKTTQVVHGQVVPGQVVPGHLEG